MHGMIVVQFKVFLNQKFRPHTWLAVTSRMSLSKPLRPSNLSTYDDSLFADLLRKASVVLGCDEGVLLEDFGLHLAEFFYQSYKHMMDASWTFEQMLLRTENIMHRQVRFTDVGAQPPELVVTLEGAGRLTMIYQSERRMCALAKGLIRGFAVIFHKMVEIEEPRCMHRGDSECRILVSVLPDPGRPV